MGEFTRKDLIELGGGWVVSHSSEALYDLQCYYEAIYEEKIGRAIDYARKILAWDKRRNRQ